MKQDNSTNLSVGTILDGKYRIDRFIKSGGFGKTYETTHTIFEERFAIKEFFIPDICSRRADNSVEVTNSDNKTTYENHRKKFFKEAVRIRRLDHPNIVKVRDVFEANGTAYYVMEYIDGKSLNDLLKERGRPFSEEEVKPWLDDLLSALEYIHNHDPKVLHLDIKPGNIMIRKSDNRAVLIDFGGCKQFEYDNTLTEEENEETRSKLSTSGVVFTKGYAPLEQEDSAVEKFNDYTDLYAVGATLFKLLTSKEPPKSSEIVENNGNVPNIPNSMSKNMRNVINRSMRQRREDRPQSVAEFRQILNGKDDDEITRTSDDDVTRLTGGGGSVNGVIGKPGPPQPPTPPVSPPPPVEPKRNDIWVWVFVAVVLLVIGIVIFKNCEGSDDTAPPTTEATEEATTESPAVSNGYGELNGHEWVDLGLSVKWATCNVGASSPSDFGGYYAWGELTEKSSYTVGNSKTSGDSSIGDIGGHPQYDVATATWGSGWRLPTKGELEELKNRCEWEWTTEGGHNGYRVTGPNGNSIFLPAAGWCSGSERYYVGDDGLYWGSTPYESNSNDAFYLAFHRDDRDVGWDNRYYGLSVRPVSE